MRYQLIWVVLGLIGCTAATGSSSPGSELDLVPGLGGKADTAGYDWSAPIAGGVPNRDFNPQDISSQGTWNTIGVEGDGFRSARFELGEGRFDRDHHSVFLLDFSSIEFCDSLTCDGTSAEEFADISIRMRWGFIDWAGDRLASLINGESFGASMLLFEKREGAVEADPLEEQWIFLSSTPLASSFAPSLEATVSLERDYLVAIVGNEVAYEREIDFNIRAAFSRTDRFAAALSADGYQPEITRETGDVSLRLVSSTGDTLSGVRVGVGSEGGLSDNDGVVVLHDLVPGQYEVKLGPEGLVRGDDERNAPLTVTADRLEERIFFVADENVPAL